MKCKKILCPLDGTERAKVALDAAAYMAEVSGAKLVLLNVLEKWYRGADVIGDSKEWKALHEKWSFESWKLLENAADELKRRGVNDVEMLVRDGESAYEIIAVAKETAADLIVMATKHHSTLGKLFIGSVTDRVSQKAPCPILWVFVQP